MTASSAAAGSVYEYWEKEQRVKVIEEQIQTQQKQLEALESQLAKTPQKKQKDLLLEKANVTSKLKSYQDELIEAKCEIISRKSKYFVPSKETYSRANDPRAKDSPEIIVKDEVLWGINDLVITLPNRTKMIVFPEPKKTFQQKK